MTGLQQIVTAAQEMIQICEQERTNKADKEKLLKLHAAVLTHIEELNECEICGSVTDLVVTMTIEPMTAKLCKPCGIKAIEVGKIRKPATRKRSTRTSQKGAPTGKRRSVPQQTSLNNIAELYAEVAKQTGLKKTDIKRLHKIIQEIASPMNLENTILYVKQEAELSKLRIEPGVLGTAVGLLMPA